MADTAEQQFEDVLSEFDETVNALESDGLSLDEALSKYEAAVQLAERCATMLRSAELRLTEIDETLAAIEAEASS